MIYYHSKIVVKVKVYNIKRKTFMQIIYLFNLAKGVDQFQKLLN